MLTNAPGEPGLLSQLDAEIDSADAIDVVMAFIRRSGINPLLSSLRRHCERGRPLRVLTTTYTGSTERQALDQLRLGAQMRISYDVSTTRLHAKAWVFHRRSGFSTAYVGSSNLTHSAQVTGLEWNVRVSAARNPDVIDKFAAVFESYWQSGDFVDLRERREFDDESRRAGRTDLGPAVILSPIELRLEPFQERLLELIALSRARGHHRNLLVAATGTGKTVMAAVDYAPPARATSAIAAAVRRPPRGDPRPEPGHVPLRAARRVVRREVGRRSRPNRFDHVFASIQSLNAANLRRLAPDHFDVVIVDEFHHAAAASYRKLLEHVQPRRVARADRHARAQRRACRSCTGSMIASPPSCGCGMRSTSSTSAPFMYFGIHDGLDLTDIPWRRGSGYDVEALSNLYTSTDAWARLVVRKCVRLADDPTSMRAWGSA